MEKEPHPDRLSGIQTAWPLVFEAHQDEEGDARKELLLRYRGAVYRYLLGTLHDPDAADELAQEFAVHFLQGGFGRADPQRGRFRDLVKVALRHLVIDHWRRQGKAMRTAGDLPDVPSDDGPADDLDGPFLEHWRTELLARTWEAMAEEETVTGRPYHTVLRWKAEDPQARSAELAARLGERTGKPLTDNALRKVLHKARALFAELLSREVARSLGSPRPEELENELVELGLLDYCRSALQQQRGEPP